MGCDSNCSNCNQKCDVKDLRQKPHYLSSVKKVIGVVSGKGGVGKSLVTSLLAITMNQKGYKTAILDADITGPSIPKIFGIKGKAHGIEEGLLPSESKNGIKVMSSNLLLENDTDPIVWRGPVIANLVKQFWTEVIWEDVDFLFVDMPPGTGDVPLTVFQSIGVDGIVIVTSPQELVSMIVEKAVNMANLMDIEVLGIVENYSYIECPDCKKKINVFGESKVDEVAKKYNLEVLGKLPIDPTFANLCDKGQLEDIKIDYLDKANEKLEQLPITIMNVAIPVEENAIDHHFGKAKLFYVYQVVKDMIAGAFKVTVEEQGHNNVVNKLKQHQVHVVLCNHLGEEALEYATQNNIRVVSGFEGNPLDAIRNFLQGKTESQGANCDDCDCGGDCSDCDHSGCGGCH